MKDKALFVVYDSNNSHFLKLETNGKYLFKIFTENREIEPKEIVEEFHLGHVEYLHQSYLGPFPDSNEIKKMVYELGEFLEVEKVVLLTKDQFSSSFLACFSRQELIEKLSQLGDQLIIDAEGSQNSLWNKIFN